ncbi:MAG TPA: HEAT repeat domain-containing protein, partial [Gemmataceae bacterium]|nr:HEAT repeat domain-containing protein [Gemmataceae bacterium]
MPDHLSNYYAGLREQTEAARREPPTTHDLINRALTEPDENKAWEAVSTLDFRATHEVFEEARKLCRSECPQERRLGADILGQLGIPDRLCPDECAAILAEMSAIETDLEALGAICTALGHLHHPDTVEPLLRWKRHPDAEIRWHVAVSLGGHEEPDAVEALIELSTDPDEDVRDWATFGLGSRMDLDTPRIREALCDRLNDPDPVTRAEAFVGLARRKDERVIAPLIEALDSTQLDEYEPRQDLVLEAVEEMADP